MGIRVINSNTENEIEWRIRQDINTARMIYNYTLERLAFQVQLIVLRTPLTSAIKNNDTDTLKQLRSLIRKDPHDPAENSSLDMLNVVDAHGNIIYSPSNPEFRGDNISYDNVLKKCLRAKIPVSSGELLSLETIKRGKPPAPRQSSRKSSDRGHDTQGCIPHFRQPSIPGWSTGWGNPFKQ
ncbi:MAG: hypothetical protein HQ589_06785 [Syntrophaceae bacterium]|nr:hypothetical protein [Syntrophaceae bacterium]